MQELTYALLLFYLIGTTEHMAFHVKACSWLPSERTLCMESLCPNCHEPFLNRMRMIIGEHLQKHIGVVSVT